MQAANPELPEMWWEGTLFYSLWKLIMRGHLSESKAKVDDPKTIFAMNVHFSGFVDAAGPALLSQYQQIMPNMSQRNIQLFPPFTYDECTLAN